MNSPRVSHPRWLPRKRWLLAGALLALGLPRCVSLRMSDRKVRDYFANRPAKPTFGFYAVGDRRMHYAQLGADSLPMVLFVHGSPGSWDAFIQFFTDSTLYQQAQLVSVDRPGFGKSNLGESEPSLRAQAAALVPLLRRNRSARKPILVGHSLGGPVVARLAMDYPEAVGGLILVAPSIDPAMERFEWYRHVGNVAPVRLMLPVELDVSNQEILPLRNELAQMVAGWSRIRVPVTVIQGEDDDLVPAANADFAQRVLVRAPVTIQRIPGMNHFIPWSRPDLIRVAILRHLHP
jgi:pimeloyl-ACP methyl ester carboxylesterase